MFDVGGGELLLIVLAILVLFGPKKLPEIAKTMGKGMQKIKEAQQQFTDEINNISKDVKSASDIDNSGVRDQSFDSDASVTYVKEPTQNLDDDNFGIEDKKEEQFDINIKPEDIIEKSKNLENNTQTNGNTLEN
jgi:sec-independent protein translocase protein TatA